MKRLTLTILTGSLAVVVASTDVEDWYHGEIIVDFGFLMIKAKLRNQHWAINHTYVLCRGWQGTMPSNIG